MRTGAIAPSSRFLARRMIADLDLTQPRVVVELGSGTGVFTVELSRRMGGQGTLILVERSEEMAAMLQKRFPHAIVICDCVSNLGTHLKTLGYDKVDYIVSGLPWTLFSQELQAKALSQIRSHLKPGGLFVTFLYMHGMKFLNLGHRFERHARTLLGSMEKSRPVWRNLPPARVWTWRNPARIGDGDGQLSDDRNKLAG